MTRVQTAKKAAHASSKPSQKPAHSKPPKLKKSNEKIRESQKSKGKSPARPDKYNSLREEILALGGDEEDYELLKYIDSDEDVSAAASSKKDVPAGLSKDLQKLLKKLDFASARPDDADENSDPEEDMEDEAREEPEEESEEDSASEANLDLDASQPKLEKKEEKQTISIPKIGPNSRLLLEPTPQWYTLASSLPSTKTPLGPPSPQTLSQKQSRSSSLHSTELSAYETATSSNKLTSSSSEVAFLQRILTSGTLSDRLSALTLMAQSSPVHNTRALETLRGMSNKKGREESLKALRAIVDWWVGGGAPDRKLKYFIDQPLNHPGATDKHLLLWYFEDWLKKYFYSILQILETLSLDPLPYIRLQAMALIFTLLRDKPEQEQNLLRLLVNKLGDSERSVASRASYHLLQLLQTHPSMKAVVVREITSLILKPSRSSAAATATKTATGATHLKFTDAAISKSTPKAKGKVQDKDEKKDLQQEHSRYYAAITLNQIMISPTEADRAVARQLISLYFELFKEILGAPGKPLHSASEAGESIDHSRYAKEKRKKVEERKGKGKEKGEQEQDGFAEVEDSNSRLVSAILTGVNRALPFAKLSLDDVEFSKHIDTLFLISHKSTFNISLQALRLIMQICLSLASTPSTLTSPTLSTSIADRYYRALYASLQDTRLNSSSKRAMYLNLLLKSLKMDTKVERVKAFVRRFVQLLVGSGNGGVEFIAGGLYLLGELFKAQPALHELLEKPKHAHGEDEESHVYDPKKRDPQYANAGASPMWELMPLLSHYHPTVRLHTSQLLSGAELSATADLSLNTLSHFLDRFVYKNPKKLRPKGPSAMQPAAAINAQDGTSIRIIKGVQKDGDVVNDERFWKKDAKDVPVDQLFFHKYFSNKKEKEHAKAEKVAKRKGDPGADDSEEEVVVDGEQDEVLEEDTAKSPKVSDEEDEESEGEAEIWKAMQATNPDLHPELDNEDELPSDNSDSDSAADSEDEAASNVRSSTRKPGAEDVSGSEESDEEGGKQEEKDEEEDEDEDDSEDALSLAEASDADDLISLADVELPDGLIAYQPSDSGSEAISAFHADADAEWSGFDQKKGEKEKKRKRKEREKEEQKKKRRKLRSLPTFATYEDYAKLIEGEPEDNI